MPTSDHSDEPGVEPRNSFDDRNLFLDFLLGVISLSEQTVQIMAELGEEAGSNDRPEGKPAQVIETRRVLR